MSGDMITHSQALKAATLLFNYCNGRTCRICIFAEQDYTDKDKLHCMFKNIIPYEMGAECVTNALLIAKENIDVLRSKGRGE